MRLDGMLIKQHPTVTGILGGDYIDPAHDINGPRTQIGQITDRRGNNV